MPSTADDVSLNLVRASHLKRKADAEARSGNWGRAAGQYQSALHIFPDHGTSSGGDSADVARLMCTLHLNLSLAYGKCLKWELAVAHAEAALDGLGRVAASTRAHGEAPSNETLMQKKKAYWRRGEALVSLRRPELAVHDFARVYAMETDVVQKKAYKGKVEAVAGVLGGMPERMGGVMRGMVDEMLASSVEVRRMVERVEEIDELTMQEAAYLVVKEMEADGKKDALESARGTCCRWLLNTSDDVENSKEGLRVEEALIWRSRVCCKAKAYQQAREDAAGALRLLEICDGDKDTLVYRRLVVSGYLALGKALYGEAEYSGRDARRALKALRKAILCVAFADSGGVVQGLYDLVQDVTEELTKEEVDGVEREVEVEGTVLDRVGGGHLPTVETRAQNDIGEKDVEIAFVFGASRSLTVSSLTPFCREQLRVLVAYAAEVGVGKVGIDGVRVHGEELVVRLRVVTGTGIDQLCEWVQSAFEKGQVDDRVEMSQLRESLGDLVKLDAKVILEGDRGIARATPKPSPSIKAVTKATKPQLQLALPFKEYKLVDAWGRSIERQQRHAFCMSRVYYDRSEMESTETWVELADGSCRWRQSGSEIRLIALLVPSDISAKQVEVRFEPYEISVKNKSTGEVYLSGKLHRGIIPNDCFWTHMGGEGEDGFLITMTKMNLEVLQKHWMHSEMWWSKLFDDHPEIAWDDYAKDYSDLPEEVMERHLIKEAQKEEARARESKDEKRRKRLNGEEERRKRTRMNRLSMLREGAA